MRLIDADALKEAFSDMLAEGYVATYGAVESRIALAPTIDAEPVKHGRWRHSEYAGIDYYQCSSCEHSVSPTAYNYCPTCGAKMDGEKAGDAE